MATEALAPWARPVVGAPRRMTAADLLRMPDEARRYELVDGRLVQTMPAGGEHGDAGSTFNALVWIFVREHRLGRVLGAETGFDLSACGQPDTVLAPDVAYVRAERVPPRDSPTWPEFWPLAPDLVVDVASPTQCGPELAAKARRWLAAGVRLVWVVWPARQEVDLWRPGADEPVATLGNADMLDGLDVLPGFRRPVAEPFE
jgi:Uma2 family endonuclease